VLVDKDIVSEKYAPERDRVVSPGDAEALNWVPKARGWGGCSSPYKC
jgi:hypothetical protein